MDESCHICEWVMSRIWMSHVTYEWVMSYMNELCRIWVRMSHVTYVNESCHKYEWVMSHINESCHTHEWFMSHQNESCHRYECVMSHTNESCHMWMGHVTYEWVMPHIEGVISHMNESCHMWMSNVTYEWVTSHMNKSCHVWMSHVPYAWVMSFDSPTGDTRWATYVCCRTHWMSHVTYERVMSNMKESCPIWMSHVIRQCIHNYVDAHTCTTSSETKKERWREGRGKKAWERLR